MFVKHVDIASTCNLGKNRQPCYECKITGRVSSRLPHECCFCKAQNDHKSMHCPFR